MEIRIYIAAIREVVIIDNVKHYQKTDDRSYTFYDKNGQGRIDLGDNDTIIIT